MKAFVSYSIPANNDFVVTLLSSKLRAKNFIPTTSSNFYSKILDYNTMSEIDNAHLFVGLITGSGIEKKRVLEEWDYAVKRNIPNLLLMEDTVRISPKVAGNYIIFNRDNPQTAMDEINQHMTPSQQTVSKKSEDIVPWILGGTALIAIISLLANKKEEVLQQALAV